MLDRAALGVDQAGHADPDGAGQRLAGRRPQRLDDPGGRAHDAVGAGLGRLAHLGEDRAGLVDDQSERLGRADVQADVHRGRPTPPSRSSSSRRRPPVGSSRACRSSALAPSYGPGQPHSTTTGGTRSTTRSRGAGARRAPAGSTGRSPAAPARPARRRGPGTRPHGTSPTAMFAAVATLTTSAPARSGSSPSTVQRSARAVAAGGVVDVDAGGATRPRRAQSGRSGRRRRAAASSASRPARDGGHDRGLDLADQRRRPCPARCRAGRRRRPATAPRPRGCRGRRRRRPCRGRR